MLPSLDLLPIETAAVKLAAAALFSLGSLVLVRLEQKFRVEASQEQVAAYDSALHKALSWGISQVLEEIKTHGWDHIETQQKVVQIALPYLTARFAKEAAAVGIKGDLTAPAQQVVLSQALTRTIPSAFANAAYSPATPDRDVGPKAP